MLTVNRRIIQGVSLTTSSSRLIFARPFCTLAHRPKTGGTTNDTKKSSEDVKPEERWSDNPQGKDEKGSAPSRVAEYGNKPPGPEPTRFGDWQYKGRSTDF